MEEKEMFYVTLNLNARFQPLDRGDLEDALSMILEKLDIGEVVGGGTMLFENGEIQNCDIEMEIYKEKFDGNIELVFNKLSEITDQLGIPKQSKLICENAVHPVGKLEGLAFYANGTDLPEDVYKNCDINYVVEQMNQCMKEIGRFYSYWEGAKETALYFYGTSYEKMKDSIEKFVIEYPLCQKSRIEQIA